MQVSDVAITLNNNVQSLAAATICAANRMAYTMAANTTVLATDASLAMT